MVPEGGQNLKNQISTDFSNHCVGYLKLLGVNHISIKTFRKESVLNSSCVNLQFFSDSMSFKVINDPVSKMKGDVGRP